MVVALKSFPTSDIYEKAGAKFIDFAGWNAPVYISGIVDEHKNVRERAGFFDVSHMGIISVTGVDALAFLNYLSARRISGKRAGSAIYTFFPSENGGITDDLFVYYINNLEFFAIVNAANAEKDFLFLQGIVRKEGYAVNLNDISSEYAIFALQGPKSPEIIGDFIGIDIRSVPFHTFVMNDLYGGIILSTTGYTGELGCEIIIKTAYSVKFAEKLFSIGENYGLKLCGFGARDTLRLEAGCLLYGADMDEKSSPYSVGLGRFIDEEHDFYSKEKVLERKNGHYRLYTFIMENRVVARSGARAFFNGDESGYVTSGSYLPTLGKPGGFVYLSLTNLKPGDKIVIDVRGKKNNAVIAEYPLYKRKK